MMGNTEIGAIAAVHISQIFMLETLSPDVLLTIYMSSVSNARLFGVPCALCEQR